MPRPRELIEPKKSEQFTLRLPDDEAMLVYREAAKRGDLPLVFLRKVHRVGMAAMLNAAAQDDNESPSGFASLGES